MGTSPGVSGATLTAGTPGYTGVGYWPVDGHDPLKLAAPARRPRRGRVVEQASIDELKRRHGRGQRLLVEVDDPTRLAQALVSLPWVGLIERDGATLRLTVSDPAVAERELPGVIAAAGLGLRRLEADEVSLEEVFVELVGERRQ